MIYKGISFLCKLFGLQETTRTFSDNFWTTTDLGETGGKEDNMGNTNPIETGTNKEDGIDRNNLGKPVVNEDANFFKSLKEDDNGVGLEAHEN